MRRLCCILPYVQKKSTRRNQRANSKASWREIMPLHLEKIVNRPSIDTYTWSKNISNVQCKKQLFYLTRNISCKSLAKLPPFEVTLKTWSARSAATIKNRKILKEIILQPSNSVTVSDKVLCLLFERTAPSLSSEADNFPFYTEDTAREQVVQYLMPR